MVQFLFCSLSVAVDFVTFEAIFYDPSVFFIIFSDSEAGYLFLLVLVTVSL